MFRPALSLIIAAALIAGCSEMPLRDGPRAQLFDGIAAPRDRGSIDITIHRVPVTAWPKCVEIMAERAPWMAAASVVTLSVVHACARVPRDKSLAPGQRPWCVIAVPAWDDVALEHELRHCEGWDHPTVGDEASEARADASDH